VNVETGPSGAVDAKAGKAPPPKRNAEKRKLEKVNDDTERPKKSVKVDLAKFAKVK
jgi:hypothetical protein